MTCPSLPSLAALLGESLPEAEQARLTEHLDGCADCRSRLDTLAAGDTLDPDATVIAPPPPLAPRVREVIARCKTIAPGMTRGGDDARMSLDFLRPAAKAGCLGLFGPYEVIEVIGHGGMGMVLRAFEPNLTRIVAIKLLLPGLAASEEARQRFLREARTAAAVVHDHVVAIHAVGEEGSMPFLVMQHVAGQSLQDRIDEQGPLPASEIVSLGGQIAAGLAAAHAKGVIHRDIKPGNILLDAATGRVKITDFGLAKTVDDTSLTRSGMLAGTPEYMAPEQARSEPLDHRADLFAFGSVLYTLAAGSSPFAGDSIYAVIRRVCDESPRPLVDLRPDLPAWLLALIDRLLAKNPADRIQTADEVATLLRAGGEGRPLPPPVASPSSSTPRSLLVGGVLLAGLVALVAGWPWLAARFAGSPEKPPSDLGQAPPIPPPPIKPPDVAPPEVKPEPFVPPLNDSLLPGFRISGQTKRYETLAEAAVAAPTGATIEVRGDGPFPTPPVQLLGKNLTIIAGPESRARIVVLPRTGIVRPLLETDGKLTLIGIDLAFVGGPPAKLEKVAASMLARSTLVSRGGELTLVQCRLECDEGNNCLGIEGGICRLLNCHLVSPDGTAMRWHIGRGGEVVISHSILDCRTGLTIWYERGAAPNAPPRFDWERSTLAAEVGVRMLVVNDLSQVGDVAENERWKISVRQNVLACRTLFEVQPIVPLARPDRFATVATQRLRALIAWDDSDNVYSETTSFLTFMRGLRPNSLAESQESWNAFWQRTTASSRVAVVKFAGDAPRKSVDDYRIVSFAPPLSAGTTAPGADPSKIGPGRLP